MKKLSLDLAPCVAPPWAKGGHTQTILGHFLTSPRLHAIGERKEVPLPDGDRLIVRHLAGTSPVVVYLFHGMAADSTADYMVRTALIGLELGHTVYLVNHRGCGEGANLAVNPYHSGRGEDVSEVIEWGKAQHPDKKHLAIGFSLSGNALLCLITGLRGKTLPDFAISVNAPIDLKSASRRLNQGLSRVYQNRLIRLVRTNLQDRYRKGFLTKPVRLSPWATIRQLDEHFIAPQSGFTSADDYYERCSTHERLTQITIPTILLTAEEDPFVPVEAYQNAEVSPSVTVHIEKTGGHLGYLSRSTPRGTHRWLDYALAQMISRLTSP